MGFRSSLQRLWDYGLVSRACGDLRFCHGVCGVCILFAVLVLCEICLLCLWGLQFLVRFRGFIFVALMGCVMFRKVTGL